MYEFVYILAWLSFHARSTCCCLGCSEEIRVQSSSDNNWPDEFQAPYSVSIVRLHARSFRYPDSVSQDLWKNVLVHPNLCKRAMAVTHSPTETCSRTSEDESRLLCYSLFHWKCSVTEYLYSSTTFSSIPQTIIPNLGLTSSEGSPLLKALQEFL